MRQRNVATLEVEEEHEVMMTELNKKKQAIKDKIGELNEEL